MNVYSETGHGTTFKLYLPRATGSTEAPVVTATTVPVGNETVLAVEVNEGLRRIAVRQLSDLGYRVIEAHDGASALRTLESEHVDLLFTDVVMPGGWNGYTKNPKNFCSRKPNRR